MSRSSPRPRLPPASTGILRVSATLLVLGMLFSGCIGDRATHESQSLTIGDETYVIQRVLEVGPGSGAWVGRIAAPSSPSASYSISGNLRQGALDALFVGGLEAGTINAAGDLFAGPPAPTPSPGQAVEEFGLTGTLPFHQAGGLVFVLWSGLETAATVRLGLPAGASFAEEGRSDEGTALAPWTMGDGGNPLVHAGHSMSNQASPTFFWGDLSVSRLGTGNFTFTSDGKTQSQAIQGSAVPTLKRFAAIAGPGPVRVDYSLTGIGDSPGLYGAVIQLPDLVVERGWLKASVCNVCA